MQSYIKQYREVPQKPKDGSTTWSYNSTSGYLPKENKNINFIRYVHLYVHCSMIYKSQDMEAACVYPWTNKQ